MIRRTLLSPFLTLSLGLLLCCQLISCRPVQSSGEQISVQALATQIEQGTTLLILDVRSPEEYAVGHVPGAINIEYTDIPNQLDTIRALTAQINTQPNTQPNTQENAGEVIVYCERGVRARIAEDALADAGITSVTQLMGHMVAWRAAKLPMVMGN